MAKILLIDKDEFFVKTWKLKLTSEGFMVEIAFDGEQGWAKIISIQPNIILIDLILPKLDGFEILERLNSKPNLSRIPVIVLSSLAQESDVERVGKLGGKDFFAKENLDFVEVVEKIRQLLGENGK